MSVNIDPIIYMKLGPIVYRI